MSSGKHPTHGHTPGFPEAPVSAHQRVPASAPAWPCAPAAMSICTPLQGSIVMNVCEGP